MIQPVLIPVNGTDADLHANHVKDDDGTDMIEIYWGCSLLLTTPANPELFEYRMIVGLLYNLKYSMKKLEEFFTVSAKTIRRWGNALRNGFPDELSAVFLGSRGLEKLSDDVKKYIEVRYLELKDTERNYRLIIIRDVGKYFGKDVSGELLRQLFRQADKEELVAIEFSEDPDTGSVPASSPGSSVTGPLTVPFIDGENSISCSPVSETQEIAASTEKHHGLTAETDNDIHCGYVSAEVESARSPCRGESVTGTECESSRPRNPSPFSSSSTEQKTGDQATAKREHPCGTESADRAWNERNTDTGKKETPADPSDSESPFESRIRRTPDNPVFTHHAGLHLFVPAVEEELQFYPEIVRQTFWQVLAGAICQEQGKRIDPAGIFILIGKFIRDIDYQRQLLSDAAEPGIIECLYRLNLKFTRAGESRFFYFDPHTEVYTGIMKVLKDWCGGLKGVSKAIHMDFIHTEFGEPCFTRHADGCHDMRDRFHLCAGYFKTMILGLAPDEPLTYCIDRGIWGKVSMKTIADNGDKVITWEKGYTESEWSGRFEQEGQFMREKKKNSSSGKALVYRFKWRVKLWNGLPDGRKIIVRVTRNHGAEVEVSIVTNCTSLPAEVIIWAMFNRWLQENDFKYLRTHYGIGMLVERLFIDYADLEDTEQDRQVDGRAFKALKKEKKAGEAKMSAILLKLKRKFKRVPSLTQLEAEKKRILNKLVGLRTEVDKALDEKNVPPNLIDEIKKYTKAADKATAATEKSGKKEKLEKQIRELENDLDEIEAEIKLTPRKESRLKALVEEQYVRPAFRSRALADAIKVLARNTFGQLHRQFRIDYDNYREDHVMLRMITRSPGVLVKSNNKLVVTLIPSLSLQKGAYAKIRTFVQNRSVSKDVPLIFKMPRRNQTATDVLIDLFRKK